MRPAASIVVLSLASACSGGGAASGDGSEGATSAVVANAGQHLRYLTINVGNMAGRNACKAFEYKLCDPDVSDQIRAYIATWKPDVIMISEVLDEPQLTRTIFESDVLAKGDASKSLGGPILPAAAAFPYAVSCHPSVDRHTGVVDTEHVMDNANASHRHECVVYDTKKLALVGAGSVYGANATAWDKTNCNFDFTARGVDLRWLEGKDKRGEDIVLTAIAVHPPSNPVSSAQKRCRVDEIGRVWSTLAAGKKRVIIGGDWNTQDDDELQVPSGFYASYTKGRHFVFLPHEGEYSAQYVFPLGKWQYDHAFTNFGKACTTCGAYYRGAEQDLAFGSALGEYDGHPWAAHPGLDHRQILVDLAF